MIKIRYKIVGVIIKTVENNAMNFLQKFIASNNAVPPFRGLSVLIIDKHSILLRLLPCLHIFNKTPYLFNEIFCFM